MSKQEIIKQIQEGYWPDWEPAPKKEDVIKDIEELYKLPLVSIGYTEEKSRIITYLAMNCIEQFERGKRKQGILSRRILENLLFDLSEGGKK
jgi:hypothetical protein